MTIKKRTAAYVPTAVQSGPTRWNGGRERGPRPSRYRGLDWQGNAIVLTNKNGRPKDIGRPSLGRKGPEIGTTAGGRKAAELLCLNLELAKRFQSFKTLA